MQYIFKKDIYVQGLSDKSVQIYLFCLNLISSLENNVKYKKSDSLLTRQRTRYSIGLFFCQDDCLHESLNLDANADNLRYFQRLRGLFGVIPGSFAQALVSTLALKKQSKKFRFGELDGGQKFFQNRTPRTSGACRHSGPPCERKTNLLKDELLPCSFGLHRWDVSVFRVLRQTSASIVSSEGVGKDHSRSRPRRGA